MIINEQTFILLLLWCMAWVYIRDCIICLVVWLTVVIWQWYSVTAKLSKFSQLQLWSFYNSAAIQIYCQGWVVVFLQF